MYTSVIKITQNKNKYVDKLKAYIDIVEACGKEFGNKPGQIKEILGTKVEVGNPYHQTPA